MNVMNVTSTLDLDSRSLTTFGFPLAFHPIHPGGIMICKDLANTWHEESDCEMSFNGFITYTQPTICAACSLHLSTEKKCDTALCSQPESIKNNAGNGFIGLFQPPAESKTSNQQAKAKRGPTFRAFAQFRACHIVDSVVLQT